MFYYLYFFITSLLLLASYLLGDSYWWLALINSFRYWLFLPLVVFWIETIWEGATEFRVVTLSLLTGLWAFWYLWYPFYEKPLPVQATVKAMTFNVLFRNDNFDSIISAIKTSDPDFVTLQEVTATQGNALKKGLADTFKYSTYASGKDILGVATLSKFKIESVTQIPVSIGYSQVVKLKGPNKSFYVVNVHTESIDPLDVFGSGQNIERAYRHREEMLANIVKFLQQNNISLQDTIIAGDFNSTEGNKLYRNMKAYGFTDSYRAVNTVLPNAFTFPNNLLGLLNRKVNTFPLLRIDYIYAGSGFKPINGQVYAEQTGSDHRPFLVNLGVL